MASTIKKKKRVSKRNKSDWRKHVDVSDVDHFLEDLRLEERLGKPTADKTNEELFQIDATPADPSKLSARQQRKLRLLEHPKCHSMLLPHTKVPDPINKRNVVRSKEVRQLRMITSNAIKEKRHTRLGQKLVEKARSKRLTAAIKEKEEKDVSCDIWNTDVWAKKPEVDVADNEWITGDAERHLLYGPGKTTKHVPGTIGKKSTEVSSIPLPHPGMSYNPSLKDHRALLHEIATKEQDVIKQEKHIDRVTRQMFRKVTAAQKDDDWMTEMSQGLPTSAPKDSDQPQDSDNNDEEYKALNPPVLNRKKTLKQRRKQKEQLAQQLALQKTRVERRKTADMYRLKFLHRHIEKLDTTSAANVEKREKKAVEARSQPKRVGRHKFEEPDLEFNRPGDLGGSLRTVNKEGNLLADRFKSLQRRNIIEPTVYHVRKSAKVKKYTRPGFKPDDWQRGIAKPEREFKKRTIPTVKKAGKKVRRGKGKA